MRPFNYEAAGDARQARSKFITAGVSAGATATQFLAGGTTLIDLMKLDVLRPATLIDINPLRQKHAYIRTSDGDLRIGALSTMAAVAEDENVRRDYPVIADSLRLAASAQLRNMATIGGNLLQRTRCPYFRDTSWTACNKRAPGTGCTALTAPHRNHAVLGVDDSCISQYPGDLAVALIALDAQVEVNDSKTLPIAALHRPAAGRPDIEHALAPGDIITSVLIPDRPWRRSLYLKIRDRVSYEFAIASAAVALDLDGDQVLEVRIGLGGLAYRPWRAREAEDALKGRMLTEASALAAARLAMAGARVRSDNGYKPELAARTVARALLEAKAMDI